MKLRLLPPKLNLKGKRVLLRVDWNVPISSISPESSLKIERSLKTIKELAKRRAIVIVLTHLGRPKDHERSLSTAQLVPWLQKRERLHLTFHPESVSDTRAHKRLAQDLKIATAGSIHLLENVRFEKGEEKNSRSLEKAYASLADVFINDAFASSHRAHASVAGVARELPSYAGPALAQEVAALERMLHQPKRPFIAMIGGLKLSTKIPILESLLATCDRVLIGGAMATTFFAAMRIPIGKSFVDHSVIAVAKKLLASYRKIVLPIDVMVTKQVKDRPVLRRALVSDIRPNEIIVDIGPATVLAWRAEVRRARTILWNGPLGMSEVRACAKGSFAMAHALGRHAETSAFVVVGGGDTIPIIFSAKTQNQFDFVSTGGGALLEFIAEKGRLPGLLPLVRR
jgi:phosphoglycerate kinase